MFSSSQTIFKAVNLGNLHLLEKLISEGVDPKCKDQVNRTLLHHAAQNGHDDIIKKLIENYQVDVDAVDKYGFSALHLACEYTSKSNLAIVKRLVSYGANIHQKSLTGLSVLYFACQKGQLDLVEYLIKEGANIHVADSEGTTPLYQACYNRHFDVVKLLLKNGADINAVNWFGTPLYRTICDLDYVQNREQTKQMVQLLWDHQPKAHIQGYNRKLIFRHLLWMWQKNSKTGFISVDLSDRKITVEDLKELSLFLKIYPILSKLKLSDNPFSHDGISYLIEILDTNKSLKSLDLSHTHIGSNYFFVSSGFQRLIRALAYNDTLEHLDVRDCSLDKSDIQTLIEFLRAEANKTLKRIDFDISNDILNKLSKEDQQLIRVTQDLSSLRGLIYQCQARLAQLQPNNEERELFDVIKKCLQQWEEMYTGKEDIDVYLNGIIAGLIEFTEITSANHLFKLDACLQNILHILYQGRKSKEESSVLKSIDIFQVFFLNCFNGLYNASSAISSAYVKNSIKTPIEKMADMAKNVILGLSGFSKAIQSSTVLFELAGEHIEDAIVHGAEIVSETTEIAHIMEKIHWGLDETRENIIRKVHGGLSEKDKIRNLTNCFKGSETAASKIKSICYAITHHYQDLIKNLSPDDAVMFAKYAYLHVAYLLTSGLLKRSTHELTAEVLAEEVILWLAYVPYNEAAIRVDILTKTQIELARKFAMLPRIKFLTNGEEKDCSISVHYQDKLYTQNREYPPRFATVAEMTAINQLLNKMLEFEHSEIDSSNRAIKYKFIFNNNEILKLKNDLNIKTTLSSYQSKSKKMNHFDERLNKLESIIQKSEEEKMQFIKIIQQQNQEILKLQYRLSQVEQNQNCPNDKEQSRDFSISTNSAILWNADKNLKQTNDRTEVYQPTLMGQKK